MRPLLLALSLLLATVPARAQSDPPTVILHGGDVFTADPDRPRAQAVAVRGDRIVAVGSAAEVLALAGPSTTVLNLGGRLVVPGLNDAHIHVGPRPAMRRLGLNGPEDPSWTTALDSVRAAAAATPAGTWISGSIGGTVLEAEEATRFALDAVSLAHPVMLSGFTGHGLIINTAALRAIGLSEVEPDRAGGWYGRVAETDTLDGRLWEYAHLDVVARLSAPFSRAEAIETYRQLSDRMLHWGVTSVQQMENDRPSRKRSRRWPRPTSRSGGGCSRGRCRCGTWRNRGRPSPAPQASPSASVFSGRSGCWTGHRSSASPPSASPTPTAPAGRAASTSRSRTYARSSRAHSTGTVRQRSTSPETRRSPSSSARWPNWPRPRLGGPAASASSTATARCRTSSRRWWTSAWSSSRTRSTSPSRSSSTHAMGRSGRRTCSSSARLWQPASPSPSAPTRAGAAGTRGST